MLNTRQLEKLALDAGLDKFREGSWLIEPASRHFDVVMRATNLRGLQRLRTALTANVNPRNEGLAFAATAIAIVIALQAYLTAVNTAGSTQTLNTLLLGFEVLLFLAVVVAKAFATNARRRVGLPWLYLLDQRISELHNQRCTGADRPTSHGFVELVGIKIEHSAKG